MRFLDISTAAVIGLLSSATVIAWSPTPYGSATRELQEQSGLRNKVIDSIARLGLPFLQRSAPGDICRRLLALSNSTVAVSAQGPMFLCNPAPPPGTVSANLTLAMPGRKMTVVAWSIAGP